MFSSLSRQRCFLIQIRQPTEIWEFWQLLSSGFTEKQTPQEGSSWTKESPTSFRVLQSSSCPCHTPMTTTLLRQDLALSQKVNIPGAVCMQEIQQQRQYKLHPWPGPKPLPWQSAAPTGVRDPPLPCRHLVALAPGNSDGLFPLFSHLHQEEKRRMTLDRLTKHKGAPWWKASFILLCYTSLPCWSYALTPLCFTDQKTRGFFFPPDMQAASFPFFCCSTSLLNPPVPWAASFPAPMPSTSAQESYLLCTVSCKKSVPAACPDQECEV